MIKHYLTKYRLLGIALLWLWIFLISGKDIQAVGQYSFSSSVSASGINTIKQISVVRSGEAFVLGTNASAIGKFDPSYSTFSTPAITITGTLTTSDLVASGNTFYIASIGSSGQVQKYTYSAGTITSGANVSIAGASQTSIALDYSGNVWYSKSITVYKYNATLGTSINSFSASAAPVKLAIDGSGNYYYTNSTTVYKNTTSFGTITGTSKGLFASSGGYIYCGTAGTSSTTRIYKFKPDGTPLWTVSSTNMGTLVGMSVSSSGNITLINSSGIVTVYSPINAITAASATPTGSAIKLSWTSGVTDADYQGAMIRRNRGTYPTSTTDGVLVSRNITASSVSYIDAGVTANTTYYYTVFNQTLDGYSSQGVTMSATSGSSGSIAVPSIPTFNQVYKTALSSNVVYLSWSVPSTTDHLMLTRVSTSGTTTVNASIAASATSITDTASPDGSYSYKLYAVNASGGISSASTTSTFNIDTTPPLAPTLAATKTSLNGTLMNLAWDAPSGTSTFILKQSFNGGSSVTLNANIAASTTSSSITATQNGTYTFSIYAVDAYTNTSNVGTSSTLTIDTTPPSIPTFSSAVKSAPHGTQISLAWAAPSSADHFVLKRISSVSGTSTLNANISPATTSYIDSGLADASYSYQLYAVDAYSNTSSTSTTATLTIDTTPPSIPTFSSAVKSAGNQIALAWTTPSSTDHFMLKRTSSVSGTTTINANIPTSITSYIDSELADASYSYQLYAIDAYANTSNVSTTATLNIDTTAPTKPLLTGLRIRPNTASLSWTVPSSAATLTLQVSQDNGGIRTITTNVPTSVTTWVQAGLADGTYRYYLYAVDSSTNSSPVATADVVIDTVAPAAPTVTILKHANNSPTVNISWTVPSSTSAFNYRLSKNGIIVGGIDRLSASQSEYPNVHLSDGTYTFSIQALDLDDNASVTGSADVIIDTTAPATPTFNSAVKSAPNGRSIALTWTAPSSADHFVLKRISSVSGTTTLNANLPASTTAYSDSGLPDALYSYKLYAVDAYANTSNAGTSTTLTIDTTAPAKPLLAGLRVRPNTASLSWSVPSTAATITLQVSQDNGEINTITENASASLTTWAQTGLKDGHYRYYLYAIDSYANISQVATADIVVDATAPSVPTVTLLKHANNSPTVNISWTVPSGTSAFNYRLSKNGIIVGGLDKLNASQSEYPNMHLSDGIYTFSIQALDLDDNASVTGSASVIIDTTPPSAPTFNSAVKSTANGNQIALAWTVPSSTDHFVLKRISSVSGTTTLNANLPASTTAYSDSGLADASYSYKLYAVDAYANTSNASTTATLTIDATAPAPPSDCAAFATSNVITLIWTNPTTDFASVSIRRSMTAYPASLTEGTAVLTASTDTAYSDTTLKEGTYYYSLFAQDNYGNVSEKATASAVITIPKFIGTGTTTTLEGTVTVTRNTNLSTVQVTIGTNTAVTVSIQERLTSKGAIIGKNTSETGIILVASANAYWINNTSVTVGNSGTGKVIQSDGIVEVEGTLTLGKQTGSTGIYTLSGGTLKTEILAIGTGTSQFNWTGGQLQVSTVSTDLINNGSGLLKKPDTTDTLVIQGTYSQSASSTLSLGMSVKNISRTSLTSASLQSKQLTAKSSTGVYAMSVQNSFTVNGTLAITLPSDYSPKVGDRFLVIQAGSMTGTFTALSLPDLNTGLVWDTSALYTSGTLRIASESDALTITKPLNYPNPFPIKTGTRIGYRLSKDCDIEIRVYTLTGHEICRKSYAPGSEGAHSGYNTITFSSVEAGMDLPVDAYIYVLINNGKIIARGKMAVKL